MSGRYPSSEHKFIITGGPTREWIDPVRFISNPSSGKMGVALAQAAYDISHDVTFIHGPMHPADCASVTVPSTSVETTIEMRDAVIAALVPWSVIIMAAAPADYSPAKKEERKIKKGRDILSLDLEKTPDILTTIMDLRKKGIAPEPLFVVGFAAETNNLEEYARSKIIHKNLDMICVNDVTAEGAGFGVDTNIITIYTKDNKVIPLPKMDKTLLAKEIVRIICSLIDGKPSS
ncbi:MAG TPA: phosphopantothenoylcysteine decarboxylase [Spirochaetota bacterium]